MKCPYCYSELIKTAGTRKRIGGGITQRFHCKSCKKGFSETTAIVNTNQNTNSMTEEELRSKYDNKFILRKAVSNLERGIYVPENEFINKCGVKISAGYKLIVESDEFSKFRGLAPGGVAYWSHPDSIQKMKTEGILK